MITRHKVKILKKKKKNIQPIDQNKFIVLQEKIANFEDSLNFGSINSNEPRFSLINFFSFYIFFFYLRTKNPNQRNLITPEVLHLSAHYL